MANSSEDSMRRIWQQMRKQDPSLPPDTLYLNGEADLVYLYGSGFVDENRYSLQDWLKAFAPHRLPDGRYQLNLQAWIEKTPYRYHGAVKAIFDPMSIRHGFWTLDEFKHLIKTKIVPETTLSYEHFYQAIEKAVQEGRLHDDKILIDHSVKAVLRELMDDFAAPARSRTLAVEQIRQREEFESATPPVATTATKTHPAAVQQQKSSFSQTAAPHKASLDKFSQLLSGGKK